MRVLVRQAAVATAALCVRLRPLREPPRFRALQQALKFPKLSPGTPFGEWCRARICATQASTREAL